MNVGEMQRKLSLWAEQDKNHRFYDLYHLLYDIDANNLDNLQTLCIQCHRAKTMETNGWRAGCGESRTSSSERGTEKHT